MVIVGGFYAFKVASLLKENNFITKIIEKMGVNYKKYSEEISNGFGDIHNDDDDDSDRDQYDEDDYDDAGYDDSDDDDDSDGDDDDDDDDDER